MLDAQSSSLTLVGLYYIMFVFSRLCGENLLLVKILPVKKGPKTFGEYFGLTLVRCPNAISVVRGRTYTLNV